MSKHRYLASMKSKQKGLTIVEFTIVATLMLSLLLAIFEGGRYIYAYGVVTHNAKQAVRYISVRGGDAALDSRRVNDAPVTNSQVEAYLQQNSTLNNITVSINWSVNPDSSPNQNAGQLVTVTISYPFNSTSSIIPTINIASSASGVIYF